MLSGLNQGIMPVCRAYMNITPNLKLITNINNRRTFITKP